MKTLNRKTNETVSVACMCCRRKTAVCLVIDGGCKRWMACEACKRECQKHPAYRNARYEKLS